MTLRRALIGVDDKDQLLPFARGLTELGFELVATGGTERELRAADLEVTPVSAVTGVEEMLEGRVKTLHPALHAGILARRDHPQDLATLERLGYQPIDLVACNLYPFAEVVAGDATQAQALEAIDIGGPTLLRAAAKNFQSVVVVCSPGQYQTVLQELRSGGPPREARLRLAREAFQMISDYDALVAAYLAKVDGAAGSEWPATLAVAGSLRQRLRYGENPHQPGALYQLGPSPRGLAAALQRQGGDLSYTNWLDVDAARRLVGALEAPAAVVVKHSNPCGVALGANPEEAFRRAYDCDPRSAYGGIVALNRPLGEAVAAALAEHFLEVVVAPALSPSALELLAARPRLRVLEIPDQPKAADSAALEVRSVDGALLWQRRDPPADDEGGFEVTSQRPPTQSEWGQLRLAWRIVPAVKSNAIVLCRDDQAVGIGAGQMSRVEAVELAVRRAGARAEGAVLASDAFFPMPDGLELAVRAGVTAAIHPGGSRRDPEVLEAADRAGMALVATGRRHFRH
ncbi:MAG: bifunctional phosphoribosylaminoimidazolecarboxamide formyltransferase/IMP cyclohydrolase [Candidatus Dormibacteria bacterium]